MSVLDADPLMVWVQVAASPDRQIRRPPMVLLALAVILALA